MHKNILSVRQCAEALEVCAPTVVYHLKRGNLPGIRFCGIWLIDTDDLAAFIAAKKAGKYNQGRPRKNAVVARVNNDA